ncbi:MAG: zinc metallopeptidase, partial [Candidatus Omnitrophica bacterium]|nr:zinc metallopeptidase [Candidatus Omnitrophota bacterium]
MELILILSGISILPLLFWGIYTQSKVKDVYRIFSKEKLSKGITGTRLARTMLNDNGLENVIVEEVSGSLSDHYDPAHKVVRLSREVARGTSIAACGIAAHEAAHAVQDGSNFGLVRLRDKMVPVVQKGAFLILPLIFLGILFGKLLISGFLINLALFLYILVVIFYLVTLPVEFDASRRA